jgi:hypothetical protein
MAEARKRVICNSRHMLPMRRSTASWTHLPQSCRAHISRWDSGSFDCRHIIALDLVDGAVSFEDSHSQERIADSRVLAAKGRVQLIPDQTLMDPAARRSGLAVVTLRGVHTAGERKGAVPDDAGVGR